MFSCPHCFYVLVGKFDRHAEHGSATTDVLCAYCKAILRVQITTLRDPDYAMIKKGTNTTFPATTYCMKCSSTINVSDLATHKCPLPNKQ